MPLRDVRCLACDRVEERFFHAREGIESLRCRACQSSVEQLPLSTTYGKMQTFPFTTTHLTGDSTPVTITDIGALRRLEKQYGVVVHAYSQEPGNPDSPRDLPVQRPGGRPYEGESLPQRAAEQRRTRRDGFLREVMRRG